jgi:hypothetical protein
MSDKTFRTILRTLYVQGQVIIPVHISGCIYNMSIDNDLHNLAVVAFGACYNLVCCIKNVKLKVHSLTHFYGMVVDAHTA